MTKITEKLLRQNGFVDRFLLPNDLVIEDVRGSILRVSIFDNGSSHVSYGTVWTSVHMPKIQTNGTIRNSN